MRVEFPGGDAARGTALDVDTEGRLLLRAAKGLARGEEPPVLAGAGDFRAIRGAEKILADGEDWRVLGTDEDPTVREALSLREG